MHELVRQLVAYIRSILRYRWWLLSIAWVICMIGWVVVASLPDQYQASAKVFVDTHSLLKPLLRGLAVETNEEHRIQLMTRTLLSRPSLEKLTRMTDLDLKAETPEEMEVLLDTLGNKIGFKGGRGGSNIYSIEYANEDPKLAKLVVKSLLTIFVESNLGETRKDQDTAHQFLEQQIKDYEARLSTSEGRLTQFKQENVGFMSGEADGYYLQLRETKERLRAANVDLKVQHDRIQELHQQLEEEASAAEAFRQNYLSGTDANAEPSEFDRRIADLNIQRDRLLLAYTDQHPDVIAATQAIETLEKQKVEEKKAKQEAIEENAKQGVVSQVPLYEENIVYQQIKLAYSTAKTEVAAQKVIVREYEKRIIELDAAVDRVLEVEGERAKLNRDYETVKRHYEGLMERLESARLTRKVDTRTDTVRFRVIEPPRVAPEPSGPNRVLLSSLVFVIGLGAGVALAFLVSQLRPTFDDRRVMSEVTGLPVLGSVDMVWTDEQTKGRAARGFTFSFVFLGLVAAYGAVLSIHLLNLDVLAQTKGIAPIYGKIRAFIGF